MTPETKAFIETEVFAWLKVNDPSKGSTRPPYGCILHVGKLLGVQIDEGRESAEIARQVYFVWRRYKDAS